MRRVSAFRSLKVKLFFFVIFTVILMCSLFAMTIYIMSSETGKIRAASEFHNAYAYLSSQIIDIQNDNKNFSDLIGASPMLQTYKGDDALSRKELAVYLAEACELSGLGAAAVFGSNGEPVVFAFVDMGMYYAGYSDGEKTELLFRGTKTSSPAASGFINEFFSGTQFGEDRFVFSNTGNILAVEYFHSYFINGNDIKLMTATFLDQSFVKNISETTGIFFSYFINGKTAFDKSIIPPADVSALFPMSMIAPEKIERANGRSVYYQRWMITGSMYADFVFSMPDIMLSDTRKNILTAFLVILLCSFLMVVPVSFIVLHYMFTRPLKNLEKSVKKVESVDYKTFLTIEREDELGELIKAYNDMIKRIKQREVELEQMNIRLETLFKLESGKRMKNEQLLFDQQKFVDMGQMVNAIAHQWRQPLNIIGLSVQSFVINYRENRLEEGEAEEFENKVMNMLMHMSATIDDFRNFFRADKTIKIFSASQNMLEVIRLIGAQMKYNAITLNFRCVCGESNYEYSDEKSSTEDCACRVALVSGSPGELKQAFLNIIQNAKDAMLARMKDGGIYEGMLDISITCDENYVKISIKDNGGGIDNDIINKIFDPYFTTKENENGTGIGLYMTKSIIENNMGGKITFENTGGGAVFYITLPKAEPKESR